MQVQFGNYTCNVLFSQYAEGNNIAIQLVDARDGQLVATATLNPEAELDRHMVVIENEGMLEALMGAGIISPPVSFYQTGHVTAPVCMVMVMPEIAGEELVRGEGISRVNWVAHTDEFTTYEFETNFGVYVAEQEMDVDEFRLMIYKDGTVTINTTFYEDYDIGDEVQELFDVDSIRAACEAAEPDIDDLSEEYHRHYAEREEV